MRRMERIQMLRMIRITMIIITGDFSSGTEKGKCRRRRKRGMEMLKR
jgi:hypothetical protein